MNRYPLHHIGIIVATQEKENAFCEKFGLEVDYTSYAEIYQADCIMTKPLANETPLEFIVPREGTLFNNGKGGIHHIAFEVADIEAARLAYQEMGMHMSEEHAVPGNGEVIVNFLWPKYGEGILVEFVQKTAPLFPSK